MLLQRTLGDRVISARWRRMQRRTSTSSEEQVSGIILFNEQGFTAHEPGEKALLNRHHFM